MTGPTTGPTTSPATSPAYADWTLWSTHARLVVTDAAALPMALTLLGDLLAEVELACSRFREDSELRRLRVGPDGAVRLSPMLADLVRSALDVAERTDGAVDPTVGEALSGLGYDRDLRLVPRDGRLVAVVRPVPGFRSLRLDGDVLQVRPGVDPAAVLDLGATAKAYAADAGARLLAERMGIGALVSLGGDLATAGPAPEGGWHVTVADDPRDPAQTIGLEPGWAVATSSTTRRTWLAEDGPHHHIVDPRTGRDVPPVWRTVTVAAPSCLLANAASTAAVVQGAAAPAWLAERGLDARLVDADGRVTRVRHWPSEQARVA